MTTSISSVNAGSTAASEVATKKSTLSSETKAKLEALGITATDGMTESEAKAKIAQAEAENNSQNQNNQQQGNSSESEILSEAPKLLLILLGYLYLVMQNSRRHWSRIRRNVGRS